MGFFDGFRGRFRRRSVYAQEFADFNSADVSWSPERVKAGAILHLEYRGLLDRAGAFEVYTHYGFDGWQTPRTILMERDAAGGFQAGIRVEGTKEMNLCFKDSTGHWDNNGGRDWTIPLETQDL